MTIHDDLREVMGLLPCPWCGEELTTARVSEGSTFRWRKVVGCCTDGPEIRHDTMADDQAAAEIDSTRRAIEAWNTRPALLAAAKYEEANPLGGPATMLEAAARRIRAGEDFHEVLADYGLLARQEGEDALDAARYRWLAEKIEAMDGDDTMEVLSRFGMTYSWWPGFTELVDAARSGGGG